IRTITFDEYVDDERTQMEKVGVCVLSVTLLIRDDGYEDAYIEISGTMGSTNRCIENGISKDVRDLSHSFIIDLEDCQIMGLFTDEEREEIKSTNIKYDPELDEDVVACLNAFNKVMAQFLICQGAKYTVQKDFSTDIIIYIIHSLVLLYKRQPNALSIDHLENWYNINLWGPIVDKTFGDITGMDVVSIASSNRKNRKRKRKDRKALGRHSDAIIRKNTNGQTLEFGGRVMMLITLDNLAGYVMRLTKGDIFEIPEDVESFSLALELIGAVWIFKMVQNIPLDLKRVGLINRKAVVENQFPAIFTTPQDPQKL
ncbi:18303_t:CDS:2, partial [Gigaspora margarita]